jgi:hypothetical protein
MRHGTDQQRPWGKPRLWACCTCIQGAGVDDQSAACIRAMPRLMELHPWRLLLPADRYVSNKGKDFNVWRCMATQNCLSECWWMIYFDIGDQLRVCHCDYLFVTNQPLIRLCHRLLPLTCLQEAFLKRYTAVTESPNSYRALWYMLLYRMRRTSWPSVKLNKSLHLAEDERKCSERRVKQQCGQEPGKQMMGKHMYSRSSKVSSALVAFLPPPTPSPQLWTTTTMPPQRRALQEFDQNVRRRPNLTIKKRDHIIGMLYSGMGVVEVAKH